MSLRPLSLFIRRQQAGVTTLATLVIAAATLTITAALLAVTTSQLRLTQKQDDRVRAVLLAESGIDLALTNLKTNSNYAGTGQTPITLSKGSAANGTQVSLGTVSVSVSSAGTNLFRVSSTGTNTNASTATVLAIVQGTTAASGDVSLSRYAILAQSDISIGGTPDIKTSPLNQHNADAHANGNVSMNGNPTIDGSVTTVGTQSYSGVPSTYGSRTTGVTSIGFPTESTLTGWESTWKSVAQAGTTYSAATILPGNKSKVSIATPCYIDGNLSIGSQQGLTITGTGVCYINGSVSITGQGALTNSALLVLKNGLSQTGNGYAASPVAGQKMATIVCLNDNFEMRGTVTHAGIVYTARGSISVAGNTTFTGALIAGTSVSAQGNYTQYFPSGMDSHIAFTQTSTSASVLSLVEP